MKKFFNDMAQRLSPDINKIGANGLTKLQAAIEDNNLNRVIALIKAGADLNLRGQNAHPPLHYALRDSRHHIALALVQAGADLNLQDAYGQTPLHKVAGEGAESFLLSLLKLGADPNIADNKGYRPLHVAMTSKPALIEMLVAHGADPDAKDNDGNTPLHYVALHEKAARALLTCGANPDITDAEKKSAYAMLLDDAAALRYPQTLELMLRRGASRTTTNGNRETVLHLAARLNMDHIFRIAVRDASAELLAMRDLHGNNVLHALAPNGNSLLIAQVATMSPELLTEKNNSGQTPLDRLASVAALAFPNLPQPLIDSARMMIGNGASPDARAAKGETLLHLAAAQKDAGFLDFLIRHGAKIDARDGEGRAPLHVALAQKNLNALDRLLDQGADPDLTDAQGWTVLDRLAEKGDRDSPFVQRLIVAGAAYNKQLPLRPDLMRDRTRTQVKDALKKNDMLRKDFGKAGNDNDTGGKPSPAGPVIRKRPDEGPPLA